MGRIFAYMRISTDEEKGKQKFKRQESAIARWCDENNVKITENRTYKDDASAKSFDREKWQELEQEVQEGDTIVFKDICRFTRECENGYEKYMSLMNKGVELIFLDNYIVSTQYIKNMISIADSQTNRIAKKSLRDTIELLILVELDRAQQEREITVQRITDGIKARGKKANGKWNTGRKDGTIFKLSDDLRKDIELFLKDRSIKQIDLMNKHAISRNTLKKYIDIVKKEREV